MIHTTLSDAHRYEALHPLFKTVFTYLKEHDLTSAPAGRIDLQGQELYINVSDAQLLTPLEQKLEVHQKYIDIHVPLTCAEVIGWKPLAELGDPLAPFDTEADYALYAEVPTSYALVRPGEILIAYPEDAHAPIIGKGNLRKLIVKVAL